MRRHYCMGIFTRYLNATGTDLRTRHRIELHLAHNLLHLQCSWSISWQNIQCECKCRAYVAFMLQNLLFLTKSGSYPPPTLSLVTALWFCAFDFFGLDTPNIRCRKNLNFVQREVGLPVILCLFACRFKLGSLGWLYCPIRVGWPLRYCSSLPPLFAK